MPALFSSAQKASNLFIIVIILRIHVYDKRMIQRLQLRNEVPFSEETWIAITQKKRRFLAETCVKAVPKTLFSESEPDSGCLQQANSGSNKISATF